MCQKKNMEIKKAFNLSTDASFISSHTEKSPSDIAAWETSDDPIDFLAQCKDTNNNYSNNQK